MSRRLLLSRLASALGGIVCGSGVGRADEPSLLKADEEFLHGVIEILGTLWLRKPSQRDMFAGFYRGLADALGAKYSKYFETPIPVNDDDAAITIYLGTLFEISKSAPQDAQEFAVRVLMERSINAYLGREDQYAEFVSRTTARIVLDEKVSKGYVGIGVVLKKGEDGPVCYPISGSQASLEGVRKGDVLLTVNRREARFMTIYEAAHRLRGKPSSTVLIQVRHGEVGAEEETFEIERVKTDTAPVERRIVGDAHHLRLSKIEPAVVEALKTVLTDIGPRKEIVLDLRGNPGGDYMDAVRVAQLFLPKGVGISKLRKLSGEKSSVSENIAPYVPSKFSILQDGSTGSGAELIIVALAAYKPLRTRTFGGRTFGKGVSQIQKQMDGKVGEENEGLVVLTDAKMYGPNNEDWDDKGLEPDDELPPEFAK